MPLSASVGKKICLTRPNCISWEMDDDVLPRYRGFPSRNKWHKFTPPLRHMTCKKKHIHKVVSALSMEDIAAAVTSNASTFHPDIHQTHPHLPAPGPDKWTNSIDRPISSFKFLLQSSTEGKKDICARKREEFELLLQG